MKYCMTTVIMLDTNQYKGSPEGKERLSTPNMTGMVHSIMVLVDCCCAVVAVGMVIFWVTHMDAPTRTGRMKYGSGCVRVSQKNEGSTGRESTMNRGSQPYRCWER